MKSWKLILGIIIMLAAVGAVLWSTMTGGGPKAVISTGPAVTVKIFYGSEKKGLLADGEFQKILKDKYNLQVDGVKMGSLEMAKTDTAGVDGLWPSSELAALVFKNSRPGRNYKSHNIFNTPIVLYSWPEVVEALIHEGVVEHRQQVYYVVNMPKYLQMILDRRTWKSIGLPRQNGLVGIHSTDPRKSNSGFLMAGLLTMILNQGEMVDQSNIDRHLETIKNIYQRLGFLENSTGTLFDKYVKQGQGAFPIVSAYENLIIEFYRAYPDYRTQIRERMRTLIPEPTVWSEHPFIALTQNGEALMTALLDPDIQKLAWDKYGFRSGVLGIENDPAILTEIGLPATIDVVTPLPAPEVMDRIMGAL